METGIRYDMPELEYRKLDALNASTLKQMRRSALHAWQALSQPTPSTAAMQLGTAVHLALLEPGRYAVEHVIGPSNDRRTKAWKEWAEAEARPLKLSPDEAVTVERIRESFEVPESRTAYDLIRRCRGRSEATAIWPDPEIGVLCKARADRVCVYEDAPVLVELKTARDASPQGFRSAVRQYGYDLAAAWYLRGFRLVGTKEPRALYFVAVETEPPYAIATYVLPELHLESAEAECLVYGQQFAEAKRSGFWPGYEDAIVPLELYR